MNSNELKIFLKILLKFGVKEQTVDLNMLSFQSSLILQQLFRRKLAPESNQSSSFRKLENINNIFTKKLLYLASPKNIPVYPQK